jgi:hypothetical protein
MAPPRTNFADQSLIQNLFGKTTYTFPTTLYFALSTTTPAQPVGSLNFTEPSGNAYARVAVTNNTTNFVEVSSPPTDGYEQANGTAITFPTATGSWGTVTYFGVYDALTSGNCIGFGALTTSQTIGLGDTPSFAIQAATFLLS